MISIYNCYCRYTLTGEIVRLLREGYQGWYVLFGNSEKFVQNYYLEEL